MKLRRSSLLAGALAAIALAAPSLAAAATSTPNTGKRGSSCKPAALAGRDPGPRGDLDTTSLGAAAPAAYEIGEPTSAPERFTAARRVLILVHGGGWFVVGSRALRAQRALADKWRAAGWETVSTTYRACEKSVGDVTRLYDLIRSRVGPSTPICLIGQSAGGHLALMVAAKRRDVACVISMAAPTDLRTISAQGQREAANGIAPAALGKSSARAENLAVAAFSRKRLRARSPVALAPRIHARLLLATAANDVVIPQGQAKALAAAVTSAHPAAYADVASLATGSMAFVHGRASAAAVHNFDSRAAALVARYGRAPTGHWTLMRPSPFPPPFRLLGQL